MSHSSYGETMVVRMTPRDIPGALGEIKSIIGNEDGLVGAVDVVDTKGDRIIRDVTFCASEFSHGERIIASLQSIPDVEIVITNDRALMISTVGTQELSSKASDKKRDNLSLAHTPEDTHGCRTMYEDPDEIVRIIKSMAPNFGDGNLVDISATQCVDIEQRLAAEFGISAFHDDQNTNAIVVLAALMNALHFVGKCSSEVRIVVNGAGAAGVAIARLLQKFRVKDIIVCDRSGAIHRGRSDLTDDQQWLSLNTNRDHRVGKLSEVIAGADVFISVTTGNALSVEDVGRMNHDAIVFALANPNPEIAPEAITEDVKIIATSRSGYPNQISNVLCFPGLFRGLLNARARNVNDEMKVAAARAIADTIPENELRADYIVPGVFDRRVPTAVAEAVSQAAVATGESRCG